MKKVTKKRTSTRRFVILYAGNEVMPATGKRVSASRLFSVYSENVEGFRKPISKDRFCRILIKNGYRFRPGLYGGYFEDVKFI